MDDQRLMHAHRWCMQGGAVSVGAFLETAPPAMYLVYMIAAGFGLPVGLTFQWRLDGHYKA